MNGARELRKIGAAWIVMAPIGWVMAAISTVKDETFYQIQLATFTVGAAAAVVFGLAAVFGQRWARLGLFILSCIAALGFVGPGLVLMATALRANRWEVALMGAAIALCGLPFAVMALQLQRLGRLRTA